MRYLRSARWLLLALFVFALPLSSRAGVLISVGFAPPALPVYEQPPCPEPGLMWTPGYWAYGDEGYYWVPGTWVPAPHPGYLWTPGYWGWEGGQYRFHDGYWGPHVGYYGGVNYGFGYGGIGFAGGEWRGREFHYNTAVVHVDRRFIHNTFEDRGRVDRGFVARDSHIAFSGGPGGIRHDPGPQERFAEHDQHVGRTSFQNQHENTARSDRNSFANHNGGRPANAAVSRPFGDGGGAHPGAEAGRPGQPAGRGNQPAPQSHGGFAAQPHDGPAAQSRPMPQSRPAAQPYAAPQSHSAQPAQHFAPEQHSAPAQRSAPAQQHSAPAQQHSAPAQQHSAPAQQHSAPAEHQEHGHK
jgi:hypothetical protein